MTKLIIKFVIVFLLFLVNSNFALSTEWKNIHIGLVHNDAGTSKDFGFGVIPGEVYYDESGLPILYQGKLTPYIYTNLPKSKDEFFDKYYRAFGFFPASLRISVSTYKFINKTILNTSSQEFSDNEADNSCGNYNNIFPRFSVRVGNEDTIFSRGALNIGDFIALVELLWADFCSTDESALTEVGRMSLKLLKKAFEKERFLNTNWVLEISYKDLKLIFKEGFATAFKKSDEGFYPIFIKQLDTKNMYEYFRSLKGNQNRFWDSATFSLLRYEENEGITSELSGSLDPRVLNYFLRFINSQKSGQGSSLDANAVGSKILLSALDLSFSKEAQIFKTSHSFRNYRSSASNLESILSDSLEPLQESDRVGSDGVFLDLISDGYFCGELSSLEDNKELLGDNRQFQDADFLKRLPESINSFEKLDAYALSAFESFYGDSRGDVAGGSRKPCKFDYKMFRQRDGISNFAAAGTEILQAEMYDEVGELIGIAWINPENVILAEESGANARKNPKPILFILEPPKRI